MWTSDTAGFKTTQRPGAAAILIAMPCCLGVRLPNRPGTSSTTAPACPRRPAPHGVPPCRTLAGLSADGQDGRGPCRAPGEVTLNTTGHRRATRRPPGTAHAVRAESPSCLTLRNSGSTQCPEGSRSETDRTQSLTT